MQLLNIILKKIDSVIHLKFRYLLSGSIVIAKGEVVIGKQVRIVRSKIIIERGSSFIVGDNCLFDRVLVKVDGNIKLGNRNIFEQQGGLERLKIVGKGSLVLGDCNRIRARMWIRFNGKVEIGNYTNINERTEIRCDEYIKIGDFSRISYDVLLWDTNTHNIYPSAERRKLIVDNFPILGVEYEKPKTEPVLIGNDCWISKDVALLKGTTLQDRCIVGYGTVLTNVVVKENTTIFLDIKTRQVDNCL